MALAVTKANEFGIRRLAAPTAGNAGGAMAAYAARAGLEAYVFMPQDTPAINVKECWLAGAKTFASTASSMTAGESSAKVKRKKNWFDLSTLKEPYPHRGQKNNGTGTGRAV